MKRDLAQLSTNVYDLCIIGGGIYGACVAWDAALRGLSVALVEKADFGSATSANSLKIIHGGLRYLQHADFKRMRESICEQRTLMRIAPHLVHPLPVLIPTYGHGIHGKEVFSLALMINDLIGLDRNRLEDPQKHIPPGRTISRREVMLQVPEIRQQNLTGGVVFYDAQVHNSERLVLSFLRSAEKAGADLANYAEVTRFLKDRDNITGVETKDVLTGDHFNIRAKTVVNTSGPWVDRVLSLLNGCKPPSTALFAKAINLITRPLFQTYAVGISGKNKYHDEDTLINKGTRFLFITPWRGHSLIGTAYKAYDGEPDDLKVNREEIQDFVDEINHVYPAADLKVEDVSFFHGGLVSSSGICLKTGDVQRAKHYQIHDHRNDRVKGLISVVGVKYTTARYVAEKVVDRVFESWGQKPLKSVSSQTPLHGGQIEQFQAFLDAEIRKRPYGLREEMIQHLIYNYGSAYPEVLRYSDKDVEEGQTVKEDLAILKAEILHGIHEEMAHKLSDVVFRRTGLGTAGHPGDEPLSFCASIMGMELGWSPSRTQQELQEVNEIFPIMH